MLDRHATLSLLLLLTAAGPAIGQVAPIYPIVVPQNADPLLTNLAIPSTATTQGMWSTTQSWPLIGLHLTVMPDGRVLSFGTPAGQGYQDGRTLDLWDPTAGFVAASHVRIADGQTVDSFCGAAVTLPTTGSIFVAGGASTASGYTAFASTVVSPALSTAVNAGPKLAAQRWYGTMTTLADGRPLMTGGGTPYAIVNGYANPTAAQPNISITPEIYTPGSGWTSLFNASSNDAFGPINNRAWYPRQWVVPNGKVFGISTDQMWMLDPTAGTIRTLGAFKTTVDNTALPNVGPTSTAVMYDTGLILQAGGNGYNNGYASPSSPYATTFNVNGGGAPVVTETNRMTYPRQWPSSLVLPDGRVLVTGGSKYADNAGTDAVYPAELWNPSNGQWVVGASAANYRGYHSATALLADGTVLSTGGGAPGPVNNLNAEIYYPPYLFAVSGRQTVLATRPRLVSLSANATDYGARINVQMADASAVSEVALIGLSSVTHSFNTFQRRLRPTFSQNGAILTVTMPASGNLAPPGYYFLFVSNAGKVPSVGTVLGIHAIAPPARSVTALLPVDNVARALASGNVSGSVIRHYNFVGYLNAIGPGSAALDKADASFFARKGLANATCYSFESKNYPGYYLRSDAGRIKLLANDNSAAAISDGTFCAVAGLNGSGFSLQSYSKPDSYMRHRNQDVWLDANDGSAGFKGDASFVLASEDLPVDNALHSIANLSQSGALVRHANYVGYVSPINAAGTALEIADSSFYVRRGNANAACYSFEASNFPGYFLRRNNGAIALARGDGTAQFNGDSTMCLAGGLAGQGFSLIAYGTTNVYLRQNNGQLFFAANDGGATFNADATFSVVPPTP